MKMIAEFMFQDYEVPKLFESLGLISECHMSDKFYEVLQAVKSSNIDTDKLDAYLTFVSYDTNNFDINELIEKCEEDFIVYESEESDFYNYYFDNYCDYILDSLPDNLVFYFNVEKYVKDIVLEGGICEDEGYYFHVR